mgnify:CR=1 FL=1
MIRSTTHSCKFANVNKRQRLSLFLKEYRCAISKYVEFLWNNNVTWGNNVFNISKSQLNCPSHLDYNLFKFDTLLSARALSSAATQACSMVKAAVAAKAKKLFFKDKLSSLDKDYVSLQIKIDSLILVKPSINSKLGAELSSKCADLIKTKFGYCLRLKCIGKQIKEIRIPIKQTSQSIKWSSGEMLESFLIRDADISLRFKLPDEEKSCGNTVGFDQGIRTLFSSSDGSQSSSDIHGHTFASVIAKLARRKKGSRGFRRAQAHRENHIGWALNKINWQPIKTIQLEDIGDMNRYRSVNRNLQHWTPGLIERRLMLKAEEHGVRVLLLDPAYRSQRCSSCGYVHKQNRKGLEFKCLGCSRSANADLNAALNNSLNLSTLPSDLRSRHLNRKGFYWYENQEFRVPDTLNKISD